MARISCLALAALLLPHITPAYAAVLYQSSAASIAGTAEFQDDFVNPAVGTTGSLWATIDQGSFSLAEWTINGEQQVLWWEDVGDPEPFLNGNEYFYSPLCSVDPGAPTCGTTPLRLTLVRPDVLRIDFVRPPEYNNCNPFPGYGDCAVSYSIGVASFNFVAASSATTQFSILDTNPVPEPASWALLVGGFGLVGAALRRTRSPNATG